MSETCQHCDGGVDEHDMPCVHCDGTGIWFNPDPDACPYDKCPGDGILTVPNYDNSGTIDIACQCNPDADEEGQLPD